jgi:hypothetical protein
MKLINPPSAYVTVGITLLILSLLSFTPVFAQASSATVEFSIRDGTLTLSVNSPVAVERFQVAVNTSKGYTINHADAKLSGFMTGGTSLVLTESREFNQYRWFSLDSPGGQQGSMQVPITPPDAKVRILLVKVDLQDSAGKQIPIDIALPKEAQQIITVTTTVTATVTTTQVRTTTAGVTTTVTTTQPARTVTQTVTAAPQTTTVTTTSTTTTTVRVPGPEPILTSTGIAAIVVLIVIIIALVILGMRRARRV